MNTHRTLAVSLAIAAAVAVSCLTVSTYTADHAPRAHDNAVPAADYTIAACAQYDTGTVPQYTRLGVCYTVDWRIVGLSAIVPCSELWDGTYPRNSRDDLCLTDAQHDAPPAVGQLPTV